VQDHCRAIELVVLNARAGETYNVGSGIEASVEQIADLVLDTLGKPASLKTIVPDRPGHDRRYLLDSSKIRRELGWAPQLPFEQVIRDTVLWYAEHRDWWEPLRDQHPYKRRHGPRSPRQEGRTRKQAERESAGTSRGR
jgi:dTDP-glucose 4,6-dehydratase